MITKTNKKLMCEYLDMLPLVKETHGRTTYWFLPETDSSEWVVQLDEVACRVVSDVRVEDHPRFGPEITTYHSSPYQDFALFKNAVDYAMVKAEEAQRQYHFRHNEWKAEHMRDCAKGYEV